MSTRLAAIWLPLWIGLPSTARANQCSGSLSGAEIVRCALTESLDVRVARQELKALGGRRVAAGIVLPANPVASVTFAERRDPTGASFFNWYVLLAQEIEIGGQRGARRRTVDAELAAQVRRVAVAELDTASSALRSYYEVMAAKEVLSLSTEVAELAQAIGAFAEERAKASLMAPVDADLLRAESIRIGAQRFAAERRIAFARALLATLLGRTQGELVDVDGVLAPLPLPTIPAERLIDQALTLRGEIAAAEMEKTVREAELQLLRRSRIPNLTFSFLAQNDGLNERVLGGGLSVPIPLPAPLGRTFAGQITEQLARIEQAQTSVEQVRRTVRLEVDRAIAADRTRALELALYTPELITRARADLAALREGLATRQLSVREALLAQRTLIDLLLGHLDARLAMALARVDLYRVAGLPLEGGRP